MFKKLTTLKKKKILIWGKSWIPNTTQRLFIRIPLIINNANELQKDELVFVKLIHHSNVITLKNWAHVNWDVSQNCDWIGKLSTNHCIKLPCYVRKLPLTFGLLTNALVTRIFGGYTRLRFCGPCWVKPTDKYLGFFTSMDDPPKGPKLVGVDSRNNIYKML